MVKTNETAKFSNIVNLVDDYYEEIRYLAKQSEVSNELRRPPGP